MSAESGEEISMDKAEFRKRLRTQSARGYRPRPIFLGTFTDGSRYMIELQGGTRYFYLVTDLTKPSTAHNLLSTTHTDTVPQSPPNDLSGIIASGGAQWQEFDVPAGLVNQVLTGTQGAGLTWGSLATLIPGAIFLEAFNEALSAATVPNVDTVLKTITLGATLKGGTSNSIVEAEGYITFGALSTNQSILFRLKRNGVTIGSTLFLDAALGAVSRIGFNLRRIGQIAANDAFTLTISAAAADANTTVSAIHMEVSSVL